MGTRKPFSLLKFKTLFNYVENGVLRGVFFREIMKIWNFLWALACNCLLFLFGFLDRYLHRLEADENFEKYDSSCVVVKFEETDEILGSVCPIEREKNEIFSKLVFEKGEIEEKIEESSFGDNFLAVPNASKYEISFIKDFSGFIEEPKVMSLTINEMFSEWKDDFIGESGNEENGDSDNFSGNYREKGKLLMLENDQNNNQISPNDYFRKLNLETGEKTEDSVQVYSKESDFGNLEKEIKKENIFTEDPEMENTGPGLGEFRFSPLYSDIVSSDYTDEKILFEKSDSGNFSGEFLFSFMNPVPKSSDPIKGYSIISQKVHPISYDDQNFPPDVEKSPNLDYLEISFGEIDEEFIELDPNLQFSTNKVDEMVNNFEEEDEYNDEFDILLQHQENIEKMKMEMKNSKMKGLPTILENCESFKLGEDLKPLKIDEKKLEHKDRVDEIQKVYKSYSEKMRKLDILNYQTLNAINFMQLKDPNQRNLDQKYTKTVWPSKLRRVHADPTLKTIFEMHKKLEIVYIAQLCLTWETLRWEYEKAKELLEYDSDGLRSYNLVAGEFQQFQVLVQRFVENEQFLGPRVQNYAKNRCELRVFFQVPIIKEDCLKEKQENGIERNFEISISMLSVIIDETMHVLWEFLRADHKDENFSKLKGLSPNHLELQDPTDSELLMEIKSNLQMKEKRLKDILRTGNCIVKKFQKQQEERLNIDLLFAQIDLKLVSRVLKMSKLSTDQLIWCQNKLYKVKFSNRKVHAEPSFLLFPF